MRLLLPVFSNVKIQKRISQDILLRFLEEGKMLNNNIARDRMSKVVENQNEALYGTKTCFVKVCKKR